MHGTSCAYCQGLLTAGDRGDVEHFRPKSIYWWLVYSFDNYLLSCRNCNSIYKRQGFPLEPGSQRLHRGNDRASEARLLLDPVDDDVESVLGFDWHDRSYRLTVVESDPVKVGRGTETISFFGLNSDINVRRDRSNAIGKFVVTLGLWKENGGDVSRGLHLRREACRHRPYGQFARCILGEVAPELLPDRLFEVSTLVADIIWTIDLSVSGDPKRNRQLRDELEYALASLIKFPPTGVTEAEVRAMIPPHHIEAVEPRIADLVSP
jgi:uncharacterized protein (TIGR02646 family)